jgi:hypothetical protein
MLSISYPALPSVGLSERSVNFGRSEASPRELWRRTLA